MRRKLLPFTGLLFALTILLTSCAGSTAQSPAPANPQSASCKAQVAPPTTLLPGKIIMAVNATIPPVQYIDNDGNLRGMRIELGEELARRLCVKVEWVNIQFDAMIPGLQGGRWDVINTGLFYTQERAALMELVPYELQAISVSVPTKMKGGVKSTEDLAGRTIGVETGGYEETNIKQINQAQVAKGSKPMDIRSFNTFADAYQALKAGQVEAVVSVDATAKFYQDRGDFERAISGIAGSPAALAFKNADLAKAVAQTLNDMKKDGFYDKLFDEYGVAKIDKWSQWDGTFRIFK